MKLWWLGHASALLETDDGQAVYFDPFRLAADREWPAADLILITHDHYDHCSPDDISRICTPDTRIVGPATVAEKLSGLRQVTVLAPGDAWLDGGFRVRAVHAYNVNKFRSPGVPFHPPDKGYLGLLLTVNERTVYHMGDTDIIADSITGERVDVALAPVSGTYVATPEEMAEQVRRLHVTDTCIPIHWGSIVASLAEAEAFASLAPCPVWIPSQDQVYILDPKRAK